MSLGSLPGHYSPVYGLVIHGDLLFATQYHTPIGDAKSSPEPDTLAVLDRVSLAEVTAPIPVGWLPRQVVVNPTARKIYVFNYGAASYSVSIIGLDSLQPEGELKMGYGLRSRPPLDMDNRSTRARQLYRCILQKMVRK